MPTVLERFRAYTKSSNMDQKHLPKASSGTRKKKASGQSRAPVNVRDTTSGPATIREAPVPNRVSSTIQIPRSVPLTIPKRWYTWSAGRILSGQTTSGAGTTGLLYFVPKIGTDSKIYALPGPTPVIPGQGPSVTTKAPVGSNALYSLASLYGSMRNYRLLAHFIAEKSTYVDGWLAAAPVYGAPKTDALVEWKAGASITAVDGTNVIVAQGSTVRKIYESFSVDISEALECRGEKRATHASGTGLTDSANSWTDANLNRYVAAWLLIGGVIDTGASYVNVATHTVFFSLECAFEDWLGDADTEMTGFGLGKAPPPFPSLPSRDTATVIPVAVSTGDEKSGCSAGPPAATPIVTSKAVSTSSTDSVTRPISINTNASSSEQGYVVLGQVVQPEKSWFGRLASGQPMK